MSLESTFTITTNVGRFCPKFIKFSGGEINVTLGGIVPRTAICYRIHANITDANGIMQLLLLKDALDRHCGPKVNSELCIPYLPYSRQDRVCNKGEALSVKVMANLINSMKFDLVETWDCHSDVGVALIGNCNNISKAELFERHMSWGITQDNYLVSPDAGALKSVYSIAKNISRVRVIEASKKRDTSTGNIVDTKVYVDEHTEFGKTAIIVDDICDGGYTFIKLAEKLREKGFTKVVLYVTHGILSKGFKVFDNLIDEIYTTDSFEHTWEEKPDFVKVINKD